MEPSDGIELLTPVRNSRNRFIYIYICLSLSLCMYIYIHIHIHIHIQIQIQIQIQIHIHIHIYIYMYIYIYIYVHPSYQSKAGAVGYVFRHPQAICFLVKGVRWCGHASSPSRTRNIPPPTVVVRCLWCTRIRPTTSLNSASS